VYDLVDEQYRAVAKPAFPLDQYRQAMTKVLADYQNVAHANVPAIVTGGLDRSVYMMFRPSPTGVFWRVYVDTTVQHGPDVLRHLLKNSTAHCKLGSHTIVSHGRDALVIYPTSIGERNQSSAS
jgi:hypothetical protein